MLTKLIVYHYPYRKGNPYQTLMFNTLRKNNIEPIAVTNVIRQLIKISFCGCGNVLHLHWTEGLVTYGSLHGALRRLCIFHFAVILWLMRGKKVVWTVHNLVNHEGKRIWLDKVHACIVAREAHKILVHGEGAIQKVSRLLHISEKKIRVVFHGNYNGFVKPRPIRPIRKNGVRFLFFGMVRPYKGLLDLLHAFATTAGSHKLHIAGKPMCESLRQEIEDLAAQDPERVSLDLQFIADEELSRLFGWSDVVVLPYRDILTSGSLLMAMSAARPVIVPRAGLISEYIDESSAFFYEPENPKGLVKAIKSAITCQELSFMAQKALKRTNDFDWDLIGSKLSEIYEE